MHLGNFHYIWLFILLPVVILLARIKFWRWNKLLTNFADPQVLKQILPDYPALAKKLKYNWIGIGLISLLLILALVRPQWGFKWSQTNRAGVDIAIAVDVSESMLAEDVIPNRLERSRRELIDLLDHLTGDRVALISFAGIAFIETPLTLDYATFRSFLDEIDPNLAPVKGTNIEAALKKSMEALRVDSKDFNKKTSHAIILITDGEDFSGDLDSIANQAKENNIGIYIIGVGTKEGSPIPTKKGYKKDKSGNVVISKLNEQALAQLANKTGGVYVSSITSDQDTTTIYDQGIKKVLKDNPLANTKAKIWNEYYQLPLALALLLILLPYLRGHFVNLKKFLPDRIVIILILLQFFLIKPCFAESPESLGKKAKQAYEQSDYNTSLKIFSDAETEANSDYRLSLGRGSSLYRLRNFEDAYTAFIEASNKTQDNLTKAQALYNAGNSLTQAGKLDQAIKTYEESLKLNPNDQETKDNLEYVKRLPKKPQDQPEDQKDQQNDKSDSPDQKPKDNNPEQQNKQQQNSNKQNQDQQKKNQQDQTQTKKSNPEDLSKNNQPKDQKNPGTKSQQPTTGTDKINPELQSLLGSLEEKKDSLIQYRLERAEQQLQQQQIEPPEKDW